MFSYSSLDFFQFSPRLLLFPHFDIFLGLGRRADINVYEIKSSHPLPARLSLFIVSGPSVLLPPPLSVCMVPGCHGENQGGKCSNKKGAL